MDVACAAACEVSQASILALIPHPEPLLGMRWLFSKRNLSPTTFARPVRTYSLATGHIWMRWSGCKQKEQPSMYGCVRKNEAAPLSGCGAEVEACVPHDWMGSGGGGVA